MELPDPRSVPADVQLLVDEARISCSSGMLLCLDREQRLVYILGTILGVSDTVGAELLETSRDSFRQKLSRARRDLHSFMQQRCGLVNKANPCRCAKKTQAFMKAGYVTADNLLFAKAHVARVRDVSPNAHKAIDALDVAYAEIHRGQDQDRPIRDGQSDGTAPRRCCGLDFQPGELSEAGRRDRSTRPPVEFQ